jgi:spore coat protein U-like protein
MLSIQKLGLAALGAALLTSSAWAGTATSSMSATATVVNNCTISAGALSFGNYDPIVANASTALDQTATLTVTCTNQASATVTLGQGANAGAGSTDTAPGRRLTDGTNFLSYSLYQESARTTIWGNTAGTGKSYTGTGTSGSVTVYGRVTAAQNVPAGSYTDTVVATITF